MIGKTLAHYEIVGLLGKGGMGEVYRARDTKLGREVAVKVLPKELSGDPERAARFEREARTLASLQHPNVASIYGFEEVDGNRFLVMELVEGQDLSTRLREGKPSLDSTLRIARQVATGLEAAHEKGIVHRDLKPANIMLNDAGDAKILDFGLARAWFGDPNAEGSMEHSPTITAAMTQAGTILGTAAYMSPEQARGKNVDRRADIWAFGAILWEMVTGKRLFEGETISDTLAAVLRAEPEWEKLPVEEAPHLCRLIERCLVRDPNLRLRDIGEARILLQEGGAESSLLSIPAMSGTAPASDHAPAPSGMRTPVVAAIALVMLALGALAGWKLLSTAPEPQLFHTMIPAPPGAEFDMGGASPGPARLSPNGKMLAFTASGEDNVTYLYLRHLDRGESVRLSGTNGAAYPFWSPESDFIAFFTPDAAENKLRKIAVAGGPPVTLCNAPNGKGGSWNRDGVIVYAPSHNTGIHRVPSIGGEPEEITEIGSGEDSHRHPRFLPNGRDYIYAVRQTDNTFVIRLGSLDGREPVDIAPSECQAEYASGHLFTVRERVLFATPFDAATGTLTGGGTPLVEQMLLASGTQGAGAGSFSVLPSGMMVFQTGTAGTEDRLLTWGDLDSERDTPIGSPGQMYHPRISPDGRRCAVEVRGESQEGTDLWLVDLETGLRTRFTFEEGDEVAPCWTPDGETIVYTARIDSTERIMMRPVEGTGGAAILYEDSERLLTTSVHPDGSGVLITHATGDSGDVNLEFLAFEGDGAPTVVLPREGYGGRYSPDGRWIAYG
ncbi:MAG: protein kinase, partial [Gemmatimonadetes bacterium]|nr:protein kinase [Gemmatimonadota bacterium]